MYRSPAVLPLVTCPGDPAAFTRTHTKNVYYLFSNSKTLKITQGNGSLWKGIFYSSENN